MLDICDFGAVGDGATDSTGAIQAALDKAAEKGTTVFVPEGVYLSSTIRVPAHTGLTGNPTWSFRDDGGSIIRLADDKAECLIDITGAIGATLHGLCLDGANLGEGIHGVLVNKPDYGKEEDTPRIERCRVNHFTGDGVRLYRIWCFSIRSCMISHNRGNGVRIRGWDGFIMDNWFSGNGGPGYGCDEENASVTMTGNRIEWNAGGGIVLHGGNHYNITGCYIDRSGGAGIALLPRGKQPCQVISMTGNVIFRSGAPNWREIDEMENCHLRLTHTIGLSCVGNSMRVARDDGDKGEFSPKFGIICDSLTNSIVKDNVMDNGATEELIRDLGSHENVIIRDNIGSLFRNEFWKNWE
jgi:hypothetical protein